MASVACVAGERCDLPRSPQISPDLGRLRCGRALREVELELLRDRHVDRTQLALRPADELLERRRDELRLLGEDVVRRVGHALQVELVLLEGVRPADQVGARGDAVLRREQTDAAGKVRAVPCSGCRASRWPECLDMEQARARVQ